MIKGHPPLHLLKQYSERTLSPDLFLVVHDHIVSCPTCDEKCRSALNLRDDYENIWSAMMPLAGEAPPHLSGEELKAYLNENLGEIDLEIAESHLEMCETCQGEIQRLRELNINAATKPDIQSATGEATVSWRTVPPISYWPTRWRSMRVVAVALLVSLIAALLILALMRHETPKQTNQLTSSPHVNGAKNENASTSTPEPLASPSQRKDDPVKEHVVEQRPPFITTGKEQRSNDASQIILALDDGGRRITVDEQGRLRGLEELPHRLRQAVGDALRAQKLERPQSLSELDGKASTLLSASGEGVSFRLLSPVGTIVESEQPTFKWLPLAGASTYTVVVVDAKLNEVATGASLVATQWKAPQALKRGALYSWQVTAIKDGQRIVSPALPAPQAKFKILDDAQAEELKRMKRAVPKSHLAMGVLYTQAGILDKAEQEFTSLMNSNPRSIAARKLLDSVRAMRERAP